MPILAILFALLFAQALHAADFKISLAKTLRSEGGYVNDTAVRGGETYRGITRASHSQWKGWKIMDSVISDLGYDSTLNCSPGIRHKIDRALAKQKKLQTMIRTLYRTQYWDPLRLDREPNQKLADRLFDISVKRGVQGAEHLRAQMIRKAKKNPHPDPLPSNGRGSNPKQKSLQPSLP